LEALRTIKLFKNICIF